VRDLLARAGLAGLSDRAIVALGVACVLVIAFAAWRFWPAGAAGGSGLEVTEVTDEIVAVEPESTPPGTETTGTAASVTVHVVGAVHRPGVYALAEGSRVRDALAAAGGCVGDAMLEAVNLARILADGEQVRIPTAEEVAAGAVASAGGGTPSTGGPAQSAAVGGKVNINTASVSELDTLPGVGPSTAQKIVDDRTANGPYKRIEDLMRVSGIGEKKFESLKDYVSVGWGLGHVVRDGYCRGHGRAGGGHRGSPCVCGGRCDKPCAASRVGAGGLDRGGPWRSVLTRCLALSDAWGRVAEDGERRCGRRRTGSRGPGACRPA